MGLSGAISGARGELTGPSLGCSGTNSRRVRGALAPLLRGTPLSKDVVSRLVGRLREDLSACPSATWPPSRSATCFRTVGIRGCGLAKGACRCW